MLGRLGASCILGDLQPGQHLTIQGPSIARCEVSELAEDCPVLIGYIPLEMLDFVVDPKDQRLIGNPDHNGEWMIDHALIFDK